MNRLLDRRDFLKRSGGLAAGLGLTGLAAAADKPPLYQISLAQWSLHKAYQKKERDPLDFAKAAKEEFGIEAVEYVNTFYFDKAKDEKFLAELKKRATDHGVRSVLIMCDREGNLGDPDDAKRQKAVENHVKWIEAAKYLGCHSIRVNAATGNTGTIEEQRDRAADGLRKLTDLADPFGINVIVENHGGLSSNGEWLASVMKKVDHKRCGTLPDFGNFGDYDRYKGVTELMPFAKAVSAKSYDFDEAGNETKIDYKKMMKIVVDAGYRGYVGIEYEGGRLSEPDGIVATRKLLERVRAELTA